MKQPAPTKANISPPPQKNVIGIQGHYGTFNAEQSCPEFFAFLEWAKVPTIKEAIGWARCLKLPSLHQPRNTGLGVERTRYWLKKPATHCQPLLFAFLYMIPRLVVHLGKLMLFLSTTDLIYISLSQWAQVQVKAGTSVDVWTLKCCMAQRGAAFEATTLRIWRQQLVLSIDMSLWNSPCKSSRNDLKWWQRLLSPSRTKYLFPYFWLLIIHPTPMIQDLMMSACDPRNVLAQRLYNSPWCEARVKVKGLDHLQRFLFWDCGKEVSARKLEQWSASVFFWKRNNELNCLENSKELRAFQSIAMNGSRTQIQTKHNSNSRLNAEGIKTCHGCIQEGPHWLLIHVGQKTILMELDIILKQMHEVKGTCAVYFSSICMLDYITLLHNIPVSSSPHDPTGFKQSSLPGTK